MCSAKPYRRGYMRVLVTLYPGEGPRITGRKYRWRKLAGHERGLRRRGVIDPFAACSGNYPSTDM